MAEPALAYSPPPCPALDAILADDEYSLPSSDGVPLADGRVQQGPLTYSREMIRFHLRDRSDRMAVEGDMFVYYVGQDDNGRPTRNVVAPDVFVVAGVPDRPDRNSYVLWREPQARLQFVLEIASKSTAARDHGEKRAIYASLGVCEYFLYDPPGRRRRARVLGLRLNKGYEEIETERLPNGAVGVRSGTVGLVAYVNRNGDLRWFDPVAGEDIDNLVETKERLFATENERDAIASRLVAADARIAELEALLGRRSGKD